MTLQDILLTNIDNLLSTFTNSLGIAMQNSVATHQQFAVLLQAALSQYLSIMLDALAAVLPPY